MWFWEILEKPALNPNWLNKLTSYVMLWCQSVRSIISCFYQRWCFRDVFIQLQIVCDVNRWEYSYYFVHPIWRWAYIMMQQTTLSKPELLFFLIYTILLYIAMQNFTYNVAIVCKCIIKTDCKLVNHWNTPFFVFKKVQRQHFTFWNLRNVTGFFCLQL